MTRTGASSSTPRPAGAGLNAKRQRADHRPNSHNLQSGSVTMFFPPHSLWGYPLCCRPGSLDMFGSRGMVPGRVDVPRQAGALYTPCPGSHRGQRRRVIVTTISAGICTTGSRGAQRMDPRAPPPHRRRAQHHRVGTQGQQACQPSRPSRHCSWRPASQAVRSWAGAAGD